LRKELGVEGDQVVLSLGHVNRLRNRKDLIEAMQTVVQRFPNSRLLIVGEVNWKEPVELVERLGLSKNVTFTGAMPRTQVPVLFALSCLETHTFTGPYPGPGIASLEAMAAGLPVITGEIDAQYDYSHFHNWQNVVMVPPNNPKATAAAIIRLLSNPSLRVKIGDKARRTMERHSWKAVCEAYVELYHEVIQQSKH